MTQRPFIIDCDTGTDDAIALMAAFGCPEINVRAITSVNGNVPEEYTSANNLNLTEYLGIDVEVARGATLPFYPRGDYYGPTHGKTGLGDVIIPDARRTSFSKDMAPEVIRRIAEEEKGELELLVIGPMTNIAIAISLYPQLKKQIKHIWFMGGAAKGGNVSATAEFNIWVDPNTRSRVDVRRHSHDHGGIGCDGEGGAGPRGGEGAERIRQQGLRAHCRYFGVYV